MTKHVSALERELMATKNGGIEFHMRIFESQELSCDYSQKLRWFSGDSDNIWRAFTQPRQSMQ